jgi:competence protein ComGC
MNPTPPPIPAPKKSGLPTWAILLIVLGIVGVVGIAVIGLLAAIAIPNFVKAREASQRNACIAHLRQIEGAKATWELENKKTAADIPSASDLYGPTKYIRDEPICPAGGTYSINAVGTKPSCSILGHELQQF